MTSNLIGYTPSSKYLIILLVFCFDSSNFYKKDSNICSKILIFLFVKLIQAAEIHKIEFHRRFDLYTIATSK